MRKPTWLRSLVVPVSILAILFFAFVAYYMYWVPSRQRLLDDRSFRYLKTLSDQIRLTVNNYDKMMDNAVGSGIVVLSEGVPGTLDDGVTRKNLEKFLKNVAPQLALADDTELPHVIGTDYDDPPKIAIKADAGTHFLFFAFRQGLGEYGVTNPKSLNFAVKTDFDQAINRLLGAPTLSPFDVVLIAQGDGKVIFQKSMSGVEVSELKHLEDASGVVPPKDRKDIDIGWLSPASRQEEVRIAGARYRFYSQPMQVGFVAADPTDKHAANGPETWVLCGLVRADRFRSESQLIPYSYILMLLAAILLAAASYPFLKLYLTSPGERLRARDVTLVAIFTCVVAAVLTFILADAYFWNRFFGKAAEADMAKLAHAINANFKFEHDAAMSSLDKLTASTELQSALKQSREQSNRDIRVLYGTDERTCEPNWACEVFVLDPKETDEPGDVGNRTDIAKNFADYPYPFFAFWSDSKGKQRIKWTTRKRPTPFLQLDDPSVPFYPEVKRALKRQVDSQAEPVQGIGTQYSPTTGQNITTFWKVELHPKDLTGKPLEGDESLAGRYAASLVTQPISVYDAILPGGYQFAVLSPDGTVVFHSDTTRNLRENFFAETGQNPNLRSRVRMRSEGPVTATYIGRPHRMYVMPMAAGNQNGVWTIVLFRDLHLEEVLNLEMLSMVTILFTVYGVTLALIMVFVHRMREGNASRWFWPDSRKSENYRRVAIASLAAIVLLLLVPLFLPPAFCLVAAAVIPAAALIWAAVMVAHRDALDSSAIAEDQDTSEQWKSRYFEAAATLVILVIVVPCLMFFKVSADYGQWLLAKRNLLQLSSDLDNRALAVQALYQDVKLAGFRSQILARPESQHARGLLGDSHPSPPDVPVFSYHEILNTDIPNQPQAPGSATADTSDESTLLSALNYPYNESAADDRHLAEGKSDLWLWSSRRSGWDRVVTLTRLTTGGQARTMTATWTPFYFPWGHWDWLLGSAIFLAAIYGLVRMSLTRSFLLDLEVPPLTKSADPELNPATLMADLPMNLLVIGPETNNQIIALLQRPDVQMREAQDVLLGPQAKSSDANTGTTPTETTADAAVRDGRALVLRGFERLSDDHETAAKAHTALTRLLSTLNNSIVIVSSIDPVMLSSIEDSDRWRALLRSFVRIDLHSIPRQRRDEDDADYHARISTASYFHWLFAALPRNQKLVILQLAKERVVSPKSSEIVCELLEQGLVERKHGLLTVEDPGFRHFLPHALPRATVKRWESEIAGARPFSLQTSLLILGVGVVAFLVYTQGDVFNTWVTYATGLVAAVPKALQFFENVQSKSAAKS